MSGRTFPTRVLSTLPTSGVFVTMRLPRAGPHPARGPLPALRTLSVSGSDRSPRVRTSRTSPHHRALRLARPSGERGTHESLQRPTPSSCRSRGARARARSGCRFHDPLCAWIRLRSRHVATLSGLGPLRGPSIDLAADRVPTRSRPAPSSRDVHSCEDPGELGLLPRRSFSLEGAQLVGWGFRARVGAARRRPRSSRPMSAAHGCCFQRRSPHVSAHAASYFPHDARACGFTPQSPLRRADRSRSDIVSPSRRSIGVPLMPRRPRASPVEQRPPMSARDRSRDLRSLPESLGPLHQAA
jgi:hypothetical protein